MTNHSEITIEDLKTLGKKRNQQAIIVLAVEADGNLRRATWAKDRKRCDIIGYWAERTLDFDKIGTVAPFQTAFGWGNGGIPKAMTPDELYGLSPAAKQYAEQTTLAK